MNSKINDLWNLADREALLEGVTGRDSKPIMIKWFKERGFRILKIGAGYRFCVCQVR